MAPFEELVLGEPLDITRIRAGESKYLLRAVFTELFPGFDIPDKIPFARPMEDWMESYTEADRQEYRENLDLKQFNGEQKWLIFCLERFLNLIEVES